MRDTFGMKPLDPSRKESFGPLVYQRIGLPALHLAISLDDHEARQECWQDVLCYILGMDDVIASGASLLIRGGTGSGKSALAALIGKTYRDYGHDVLFATAYDIQRDIDDRVFDDEDEISAYGKYCTAKLLLIDDLGGEAPWVRRKSHLRQVVMQRFDAKLPTVVTTQLMEAIDFDEVGIYQRGFFDMLAKRMIVADAELREVESDGH